MTLYNSVGGSHFTIICDHHVIINHFKKLKYKTRFLAVKCAK
jgi:hypothetical protein